MATNPPAKILIGTLNPKLNQFNDSQELTKQGGYRKINAIRVYFTDKYVRGFEIFYKLNDGDLLKAGHNTPKKKKSLQSAVFEIGPDDYISEIQGAFQSDKKNKIVNITFLTYRGKAATFGATGPHTFTWNFPGHTFGAFRGGFKKQIEWLEVDVLPLPEEFKKDFNKVNVNVILNPNQFGEGVQPNNIRVTAVSMPTISMPQIGMPQIGGYGTAGSVNRQSQEEEKQPNLMGSAYPSLSNQQFSSPQPSFQGNQFQQQPQGAYPPQYPNQYNYPQYHYPGQLPTKSNSTNPYGPI